MADQTIQMTFGGSPLVQMDPDKYPEAAGKANGYLCPLGCQPGIGYVLMFRRDLAALQANAGYINSALPLVLAAGGSVTVGLYIVNAVKVSGGPLDDGDSVYMVKLTDSRWHARMSDCAIQINVRCPAPPATTGAAMYYADSLDSGAIYTWARAFEVVWNACPLLGVFPGLPYGPDGVPEGFHFIGVSTLDALSTMLDRISCDLAPNPTTGAYSIIQSGIVQPGLSTTLAVGRDYLSDAQPFDVKSALMPATIRVYFHRRDLNYGTEPATQQTTGSWTTASWHKVDVNTSDPAAIAGTVVSLWDDLPALVAFDGSVSNTSALSTRASERANNYQADINVSAPRRRTTFQGIVAGILPGSQVKAVHWCNLDSRPSAGNGGGLQTTIYNFPGLPKLVDNDSGLSVDCGGGSVVGEVLESPDFARHTYPIFPPLPQTVTVDGTLGASIAPNSGGFWPGHVTRVDSTADFTNATAPFLQNETCWIALVNYSTGSHDASTSLYGQERFIGRLNGTASYGSDKRPLYLVQRGDNDIWLATVVTSIVPAGTTGSFSLSDGRTITATNISGVTLASGNTCAVFFDLVSSTYYAMKSGNGGVTWHVTLGADVAAGANVSVTLPDTTVISATNWAGIGLFNGEKATVYQDPVSALYYLVRSGPPIFHITLPSPGVAAGASISITLPTTGSPSVTAVNWSGVALSTSDKVTVYQDLTDQNWYLIKSGGTGAKTWHVTLAGNVASGANINVTLPDTTVVSATNWSGVNLFNGEPATVYQDPVSGTYYLVRSGPPIFHVTLTADVAAGATVTVTLPTTGSPTITATNWSGIKLSNGEKATVYQDLSNQTWYLVRTGHNIFHITLGSNIAAGGTGTVTLPTTGSPTVTATNWSGSAMNSGDKVTVYQDSSDGIWYLIKTGGGNAVVRFQLNMPLILGVDPVGNNADIMTYHPGDGKYYPDGGLIAVYDPTADQGLAVSQPTWSGYGTITNTYGNTFYGCIGTATLQPDSGHYEITWMQSRGKKVRGYVYSAFTKNTGYFFIRLTDVYDGIYPTDHITFQGATLLLSIRNEETGTQPEIFIFEGEQDAKCIAEYDEVMDEYRVVWVECALDSPVVNNDGGGTIYKPPDGNTASTTSVSDGDGGLGGGDSGSSGDGGSGTGMGNGMTI